MQWYFSFFWNSHVGLKKVHGFRHKSGLRLLLRVTFSELYSCAAERFYVEIILLQRFSKQNNMPNAWVSFFFTCWLCYAWFFWGKDKKNFAFLQILLSTPCSFHTVNNTVMIFSWQQSPTCSLCNALFTFLIFAFRAEKWAFIGQACDFRWFFGGHVLRAIKVCNWNVFRWTNFATSVLDKKEYALSQGIVFLVLIWALCVVFFNFPKNCQNLHGWDFPLKSL